MNIEDQPLASLRDHFVSLWVEEADSLRQVVQAVLQNPGFHDVCVVDQHRHLLGVINVKKLFRTVFFHHVDPNLMTRHLIELAGSKTAGHLMVTDPVVAMATEPLGRAIARMVQHELGEVPVLDDQRQLLGSLSIGAILGIWLGPSNQ